MKTLFTLSACAVASCLQAQVTSAPDPFAHTFSIVARDPATGEMGVAVQSHWFSVGTAVSWAEAGVGVVATQSFVNVSFGLRGLDLLREGQTPQEALDRLLSDDTGKGFRQVAILNGKGVAVFTGDDCIPEAGQRKGTDYSVQANMMLNNKVPDAMAQAFENTGGPLAERMMAALEAAQSVGGDVRGKQSAVLLVVRGEKTDKPWEDRLIDLRVDDHKEPVKELRRLLTVYRAYQYMAEGDLAMEHNDAAKALESYGTAEKLYQENEEIGYWYAVALANTGHLEDAMPRFNAAFERNPGWKTLTRRIYDRKLLVVSEDDLKKILN